MPSFKEITGLIVAAYMTCFLTGHMREFYTVLAKVQYQVMKGVNAPWGCPSAFDKHACDRWRG